VGGRNLPGPRAGQFEVPRHRVVTQQFGSSVTSGWARPGPHARQTGT